MLAVERCNSEQARYQETASGVTVPLAGGPEKRAAFIVNPHAGRGRARKLAAPLSAIARSLGWSVDVHETKNPGEIERLSGFPLYLVAMFRTFSTFKAPQLRVESSNGNEHARLLMVEIAIRKTAGGSFRLTPDADPQDGKLDVCVIRNVGWPTFLRYLPKVMRETHASLPPGLLPTLCAT